jgi:outer membrane immunogenic protein
MSRVSLASIALISFASCAHADSAFYNSFNDEPVALFRWTGFYFGPNAGWGWAANPSDIHYVSSIGLTDSSAGPDASGGFVGGQIGYNWQGLFNPNVVAGVEADFQGSHVEDTINGSTANGLTGFARQDLEWFGTVRGRLGWVWNDTLIYGTGGFAYGNVKNSTFGSGLGESISLTGDTNHTGYVVGGGLEHAVAANASVKVEYQYINLGEDTLTGSFSPPIGVSVRSSTIDNSFHTIRAGLNIKLN